MVLLENVEQHLEIMEIPELPNKKQIKDMSRELKDRIHEFLRSSKEPHPDEVETNPLLKVMKNCQHTLNDLRKEESGGSQQQWDHMVAVMFACIHNYSMWSNK